jgi:hypothetical protein
MKRQLLIAVGLSLLLILAGCNEVQPVEENTPTTETPPSVEDLAGFNDSGVTSGDVVYNAHKTNLMDKGSWTVIFETNRSDGNQSETFTEVRTVDHVAETQIRTVETRGQSYTLYNTDTDGYQRLVTDNRTMFQYNPAGYNASRATHSSLLTSVLSNVEYNMTNTTTENETTFYTFESVGFTEDSEFSSDPDEQPRLENFTSTFTVGDDGIVHTFQMETVFVWDTRPNITYSVSLTFEDINDTTVTEPAWVSEAKQSFADNETTTTPSRTPTPNSTNTTR